ncbi:hypothetical protein SCLCIDRAFT_184206 [Scleroderma citrinum Foug A]|uniref:Uncharacterized protein n=1 Tax=Scleroderma citrinum Foug A TaxID=1036808 RepID=A0A0C3DMA9_9AGAM|nr:hypothetical protein SCLCIDRAFT_184206 [Scleroderma citrinum Foug A]
MSWLFEQWSLQFPFVWPRVAYPPAILCLRYNNKGPVFYDRIATAIMFFKLSHIFYTPRNIKIPGELKGSRRRRHWDYSLSLAQQIV